MTVTELLTALGDENPVRVDLVVGSGSSAKTYRVESNELDIIDSTTKALTVASIELKVDGKVAYLIATTGA